MDSQNKKRGSRKKHKERTSAKSETDSQSTPLPPAGAASASRFHLVRYGENKSKTGQLADSRLRLLSPCYCTYSTDGGDTGLVMVGSRVELEYLMPFGEDAMRKPLPGCGEASPFRIEETGQKGLGMFATRLIKAGELIVAERPTILSSKTPFADSSFNDAALAALSESVRESFMTLTGSCAPGALSHPLLGRAAINSFDSGPMDDAADNPVEFAATFLTLSRANHDCVANTNYQWSKTRWCGQFLAKRDIAAGEEITVSYTFALTQAERHAYMKARYSCKCRCKTCFNATPADVRRSDQRRKMVTQVRDALQSALYSSSYVTTSDESLQHVLGYAREEGMMISYATIAFLGSRMLMAREGHTVALKWLREARQAYVATLGEDAWEVSQVDKHGKIMTSSIRARGIHCSWP